MMCTSPASSYCHLQCWSLGWSLPNQHCQQGRYVSLFFIFSEMFECTKPCSKHQWLLHTYSYSVDCLSSSINPKVMQTRILVVRAVWSQLRGTQFWAYSYTLASTAALSQWRRQCQAPNRFLASLVTLARAHCSYSSTNRRTAGPKLPRGEARRRAAGQRHATLQRQSLLRSLVRTGWARAQCPAQPQVCRLCCLARRQGHRPLPQHSAKRSSR